jgi:hypothetical protein
MPQNPPDSWLSLDGIIRVDASSEADGHSLLGVLSEPIGAEWRASNPGPQVIRLQFIEPQDLTRVRLAFRDREHSRTQEFTLAWLAAGEQDFHVIVRQQFNFHPSGSSEEVEEYAVSLRGASALELRIVPDIGGGNARASLAEFRVAG